jgi:hemolysin D
MSAAILNRDALDFAPDILAIQARPPSPLPRAMLYILLTLSTFLLAWATIGRVDVVAVAQGKLIPQSYVKIVQPADGGIVKEILVKEGDTVQAGQVLMRMDREVSQADTQIVAAEVNQRSLQLRRIDAELSGIPLTMRKGDDPQSFKTVEAQYRAHRQAYEDSLAQERALLAKAREDYAAALQIREKLRRVLPAYQEQEAAWDKLHREGFAGRLLALERQRQRIEAEGDFKAQEETLSGLHAGIEQSQTRLAQITSNYRQQLHNERVEVQGQLDKAKQELAKQEHKQALLELKAPQAGIIKEVATHGGIGRQSGNDSHEPRSAQRSIASRSDDPERRCGVRESGTGRETQACGVPVPEVRHGRGDGDSCECGCDRGK